MLMEAHDTFVGKEGAECCVTILWVVLGDGVFFSEKGSMTRKLNGEIHAHLPTDPRIRT